jgi:hypothetical protein
MERIIPLTSSAEDADAGRWRITDSQNIRWSMALSGPERPASDATCGEPQNSNAMKGPTVVLRDRERTG